MFVSRKNLPLIHGISSVGTGRAHMAETSHQSIHSGSSAGLGGELLQPFPKSCVQRFVLRPSCQPRLLDEVLFGAESNIFHLYSVHYFSASVMLSRSDRKSVV